MIMDNAGCVRRQVLSMTDSFQCRVCGTFYPSRREADLCTPRSQYVYRYGVSALNIYDTVSADTVMAGDLIVLDLDYIEVVSVVDETDAVVITGYSHVSGDNVTNIVPADRMLDLWNM